MLDSVFNVFNPALFATAFTTILVIQDPLGAIPIFLSLTSRQTARERKSSARQATLVSFWVIFVFAVFGLVILVTDSISLVRAPHVAPVVGSINVAAGLLFVLLAICVAHNGRRMRLIGWMSLSALLTGAVLIGVLTWTDAAEGLEASVWADGGRRHGYLPLLLPILATGWMWLSNPRRIVINAERMDELGATLAERTRTAQSGRD